jgi:hypothetical protein
MVIGWVCLFMVFVCLHRVDPDYGWHFRTGQYILTHGAPHRDIFTYTARNFPWIDHEWLSDIFIYSIAARWGYGTLAVIFGLIWSTAFLLAMRRRMSWVVTGFGLGGLLLYIGARSDAWTALGIVLTLLIVESESRNYWWLVPLMAMWANLHAGFAAGLAIVVLKSITGRSIRLAGWAIAALLATLANPYGYGLYVELWRTLGDSKLSSAITEWAPLSPNQDVAPYLVAIIVCLIVWRGFRFPRLVGMGLCAAAIWSNRNMSLLVVGTCGYMSDYFGHIETKLRRIDSQWPKVGKLSSWVAVAVGVGLPIALLLYPPNLPGSLTLASPSMAIASLKADPCQGHLFNDYNYGGLIIWQLPGVPDYIDGRMPSWVGPNGSYLQRYDQVLAGGTVAEQEFVRFDVRCALISHNDVRLSRWLAIQPGWRLTLQGQDAQLWRKG